MTFDQDLCAREKINKILNKILNDTIDCFVERVTEEGKFSFRFFWHGTDVAFNQLKQLSEAFKTEDIFINTDFDGQVGIIIYNATVI